MTGLRGFTGAQRFLLASSFVVTLGSWAVLPYMSVLLTERIGLGLGAAGAVLAVASVLQFAGCVAGAAVAERCGLARTLLLALLLHVAGFAGFLAGLVRPGLTVAGLLALCAGAALYLPAVKAYLLHGAARRRRPRLLAASAAALNAGLALGPLAAGPFVLDASGALFGTVIVLFAALTVGHTLLPNENPDAGARPVEPPWRVLAGIAPLPFAVTALTLYLHMFFYYYLPVFTVPRASPTFYGAVLMVYSVLLAVLQPLVAARVGALRYGLALLIGFAGMAAGLGVLAAGSPAAIVAGVVLICLGEVVLFLKNDLEALAGSPRSSAVVFGQQRLAAGIGAGAAALLGGVGYRALDGAGHAPLFWVAIAAQCVLLPPALLAGHRLLRGRRAGTGLPAPT